MDEPQAAVREITGVRGGDLAIQRGLLARRLPAGCVKKCRGPAQKQLTADAKRHILCSLHIIKEKFLKEAAPPRSKAGKWLEAWAAVVNSAEWVSIRDVRVTYPSADPVKVSSGRNVTVFNVCGNNYRLIVAIHYDKRRIYTLRFMTHAEYDKNQWKKEL